MSFSFYEPWVNTAHVNDILTQRAMNNAFKFTFMLELDPSHHPFAPSPSLLIPLLVPPFLPTPHSLPPIPLHPVLLLSFFFLISLFILIRAQLHFFFLAPPSLFSSSSCSLLLHLHHTAERKRYMRLQLSELKIYCISFYYPGLTQLAAHWHVFKNHKRYNVTGTDKLFLKRLSKKMGLPAYLLIYYKPMFWNKVTKRNVNKDWF